MAESPPSPTPPKPFALVAAVYTAALWLVAFAAAVPVAVYAARRQPNRVAALVAIAVLSEQLRAWTLREWRPDAVYGDMIAMALLGVPIGWALRQKWSYAKTVVLAVVAIAPAFCALFALQWDAVLAYIEATFEEGATGDFAGRNARDFVYGSVVSMVLLAACFCTSFTARWLEFRDAYRRNGSFCDLRQPDALAWVVIAAFVLWYIDRQWPQPALRFVAWNAAVGLLGIYWTTGLALAAYAVRTFRLAPVWIFGGLVLLLFPPVTVIPAAVGLMDTWGDYRKKMDRWAAERRDRDSSAD